MVNGLVLFYSLSEHSGINRKIQSVVTLVQVQLLQNAKSMNRLVAVAQSMTLVRCVIAELCDSIRSTSAGLLKPLRGRFR